MFVIPSVSDFKNYFVRDFPYGTEATTVMDIDITNAMQDAGVNFSMDLWANQQSYTVAYLLLSAHFLVMNLRASSQGISGQYSWMQTGKGVGSVNESVQIPERIMNNPEYAMLTKTFYGAKYLFLILPQLSGQVFTVRGRTKP